MTSKMMIKTTSKTVPIHDNVFDVLFDVVFDDFFHVVFDMVFEVQFFNRVLFCFVSQFKKSESFFLHFLIKLPFMIPDIEIKIR